MQVMIAEVFDWNDDPTGRRYRFDISAIAAEIQDQPELEPVPIQITHELYAHAVANGADVETIAHNLDQEGRRLPPSARPVIIAEWHDGSAILIDGNNRVAARWLSDHRVVFGVIVPRAVWQPHCVPL